MFLQSDKMQIINAKKQDLEGITKLYYELYPERHKKSYIHFGKPILKSEIFIAKKGKEICGFTLATFTSYAKSKFGYIEELFVTEKYRRTGIGTKLIKSALDWEMSMHTEVVFVTTDRLYAINFYKNLGFVFSKRNKWLLWVPK